MEVVANGCAETFWKLRLCLETSCVLQCYLQNRKLCPICAPSLPESLWWCIGPRRVTSQAEAGSRSDSHVRKTSLPATHKNKQTDPFAKIIPVGQISQDVCSLSSVILRRVSLEAGS